MDVLARNVTVCRPDQRAVRRNTSEPTVKCVPCLYRKSLSMPIFAWRRKRRHRQNPPERLAWRKVFRTSG